MVTKKPETFETTDGREFTNEAEAVKHQAKVNAARVLDQAQKQFITAHAESCKTADGKLFDFSHWEYFVVLDTYGSMPRYSKIHVDRWSVTTDRYGDVMMTDIRETDPTFRSTPRCEPRQWKISELYASEKAAQLACATVMRKWVADRMEEAEKTLESWGIKPLTIKVPQ